jgi:hypothetical protein
LIVGGVDEEDREMLHCPFLLFFATASVLPYRPLAARVAAKRETVIEAASQELHTA